jgi:hypothetical protein
MDEEELLGKFHGRRGALGQGAELGGFHHASLLVHSAIFVRNEHGATSDTVLVHEALHALSRKFTDQAGPKGEKLAEGLTQYFAKGVVIGELGITRDRWLGSYPDESRLAGRLAELVGREVLLDAFFHRGFGVLEAAVDERVGRAGALRHAAAALETHDLAGALAALDAG